MEMKQNKVGVLLVNLGTPDEPTPAGVKKFLSEFLHDHRVVDLTRWLWCPILHGVILPVRSPKVAKLYQSVWMPEGSPLMVYSQRQQSALEERLQLPVELGMTYGNPSIASGVDRLVSRGCEKILVLPLFPQYSGTTSAAVFDKVAKAMKKRVVVPEYRFVSHYFDHPDYVEALRYRIHSHWDSQGKPDLLLCSYHGIPKRYADQGDPYPLHCQKTTELLQAALSDDVKIQTSFQSRFGREEWLKPYTDKTLESLPKEGIKKIDVISPAFSVDCLETLEELAEQCRDIFLEAGGESFNLIPCLNDDPKHLEMMEKIVKHHTKVW